MIPGNHDNYSHLDRLRFDRDRVLPGMLLQDAPGLYWIDRGGWVEFDDLIIVGFGGAESTDCEPKGGGGWTTVPRWPGRKEDRDWWKQESAMPEDFQFLLDILEEKKPPIVITHDAPLEVRPWRRQGTNHLSGLPFNYTAQNLQRIFELSDHHPERWFYGHHHMLEEQESHGTRFHCCGIVNASKSERGNPGEGWLWEDGEVTPFSLRDKQ